LAGLAFLVALTSGVRLVGRFPLFQLRFSVFSVTSCSNQQPFLGSFWTRTSAATSRKWAMWEITALAASIPFSASDGEKVADLSAVALAKAEGRMRCVWESGERVRVRCRNVVRNKAVTRIEMGTLQHSAFSLQPCFLAVGAARRERRWRKNAKMRVEFLKNL
jgi:hypothetical protein